MWNTLPANKENGLSSLRWNLPEGVIVMFSADDSGDNNIVIFGEGQNTDLGAIDFDICYPGPRLWDLAYTAYRYVPLTPLPQEPDAAAALRDRRLSRLDAFLAAYAGEDTDLLYPASALLGYVVERLIAMVEWCEQQEDEDRQRDAVMYREHAEFIANGGYGDRNRATSSVAPIASPSCHHPGPTTTTNASATVMPTSIPSTVSSTRRGRASRTSPRLEITTVAAIIGVACPTT